MSYSLQEFCTDARSILAAHDDRDGREQIRKKLELLLGDEAFRAAYLEGDDAHGVRQIHEDPEQHFCVLVYSMNAPRKSPPHDHGQSWAVYGQADGHTDMTIWSAAGDQVEPVRSFRLEPGQAGLFDIREIHSIEYGQGARFVRVTGVDLSRESRRVFDPDTGSVQIVESVGTGNVR